MLIASVDPGKTGALVLLRNGVPREMHDMIMDDKGKLVDVKAIAALFWTWDLDHIVLENVHSSPTQGVSSAFNFGANFMAIQGIACGMEVPCHLITPQRWKTYHGLTGKPKDAARLKVIDMFPDLKSEFKFKNSVDKADAVLMGIAWQKLEERKSC